MSIYYVATWSVNQNDAAACQDALAAIGDHIKAEHPSIKSVRTLRQAWGPAPRRAYVWYEEYESLTVMEADPSASRSWDLQRGDLDRPATQPLVRAVGTRLRKQADLVAAANGAATLLYRNTNTEWCGLPAAPE